MSLSRRRWHARLRRTLRKSAVEVRANLILEDGLEGFVHLDWLLLRPEGLYLVDMLEGEGALLAGDNLREWTLLGKRRFVFPNPIQGMTTKLAAVRRISSGQPTEALLILSNELDLPRTRPSIAVDLATLEKRLPPLGGDAAVTPDLARGWARLVEASAKADHIPA